MRKGTISIFLIFVLIISAICGSFAMNVIYEENLEADSAGQKEADTIVNLLTGDETTFASGNIRDNNTLYEGDKTEVVTMYLTVRKGNASEGTDHTWSEINQYSAYYYNELGIDRYKVEALLQVGDENGVAPGNLGYGRTAPNATVQIRGQTSSKNPQKNYKIELRDNQGTWNGQKTIALNKHMTDGLRYRNKLGFDLLSEIDQLMSLRTTFVHLYVKDLTEENNTEFVDYGLYTQVEQLNKTALRAHGLDRTGHLYKINFFEFYRYEDAIKLTTDPGYDQAAFEKYLEIKGDSDHTKLIKMLDDLNDYSISIDEILDKYFDVENLTYWLAFNMLTGNADTQSRNAYLYSPQNTDKWYLYCWDLDGAFRYDENIIIDRSDFEKWELGISNYWGNVLFKRCLKSDSFREKLDEAVKDVKSILTKERITELIKEYRTVTDAYVYSEPDIIYAPLTQEEYNLISDKLPDLVDFYYEKYLLSLESPMPFFIGDPVQNDKTIEFVWDESYDFQQDDIKYKLKLSDNIEFTNILFEYQGYWTECSTDALEPGVYFLSVSAEDEDGNTQTAFDYYEHVNGKVYSLICFYVNEDGTISRYTVTEN